MDLRGRPPVAVGSPVTFGPAHAVLPFAGGVVALSGVAVLMGLANGLGNGVIMTLGADAAPGRAEFLGAFRLCHDAGMLTGPLLLAAVSAMATLAAGAAALAGLSALGTAGMARWVPRGLSGDTLHLQEIAWQREVDARIVRNYQTSLVPGLLQTAEYARQLLPLADPTAAMDHAVALAARLERQQVLYQPDRRFEFLLEEMVLRWAPGPGVMRAQIDRLLSLATLESVELAVLPAARVGAMSWHPFMWWEPLKGPPYVTTELLHGGQYVVDATAVATYEAVWHQLWNAAEVGEAAVELIRRMA